MSMTPVQIKARRLVIAFLASSVIAAWAAPVSAAPVLLLNSAGELTGARNVDVDGTLFDVAFVAGVCEDIFSGCDEQSDLAFSTLDQARAAGQALLDTVFLDGPQGLFDLDPSTTAACGGAPGGLCEVWVPYQIAFTMGVAVDVVVLRTENWVSHTSDFAFDSSSYPINVSTFSGRVFATFTPAQATPPVPEPGTAGLLGVALGGLLLWTRRAAKSRPMRSGGLRLFAIGAVPLLAASPALAIPIQPPGLTPGETYHWMFVTHGVRTAESTDISVYNAFVNAQAALNPDLAGLTWYAVASTPTVDARNNAVVSGPVFLLDGSTFANDFAHMWATTGVKLHKPNINQFGVERPSNADPQWPGFSVWTGTDYDGMVFSDGLGASSSIQAWVGSYDTTTIEWVRVHHENPQFVQHAFYALSNPLKAVAVPSLPEPGLIALLVVGIGGLGARRMGQQQAG